MLNIINDILDFSKIEAGKLELENISLSIDQVISDSIAIYTANAKQKRRWNALRRSTTIGSSEITPAIVRVHHGLAVPP